MFSLLLMSSVVTVAQPFRLEGMTADSPVLAHALNAPERPRTAKVQYCVRVEGDAARSRVCRTKREWQRLGLEPLHG